jgi:hypothetical protein
VTTNSTLSVSWTACSDWAFTIWTWSWQLLRQLGRPIVVWELSKLYSACIPNPSFFVLLAYNGFPWFVLLCLPSPTPQANCRFFFMLFSLVSFDYFHFRY